MKQKRMCSVPDCPFPHAAKGLCQTHYRRKKRTGTTDERTYQADKPCRVAYCTATAKTKGYCPKHYGASLRHGDPYVIAHAGSVKDKTCCILGCNKPQRARGVCHNHYFLGRYHQQTGAATDYSDYIHTLNADILASRKEEIS